MRPEQIALFREQGYLHLRGALRKEVVQPVKVQVLNELKRLKIWSTGRVLSNRMKGVPAFQQITKLGQLIKYPGLKDRLISQDLSSTMSRLAGASLIPEQDAQLLISLPKQGDWTLDSLNWHRDISQSELAQIPGVQAFVLIDDLSPRGGATLALAGSHRLKGRPQGKQSINRIVSNRSGPSMTVGDVDLSILEMAGQAGDVYLMDMRLIHTPSINSARNVRMMATIRYLTT